MRRLSFFCFSIASLLLFSDCKKGEDDPLLSLRTRKARLAGEWRLLEGEATIRYNYYTSRKYNLNSLTIPRYALNLKIKKDGTFTCREYAGIDLLDAEGSWIFNSGVGEDKKKEKVMFVMEKVNRQSSVDYVNFFGRGSTEFIYTIQLLKEKELIIHSDGKIVIDDSGNYINFSNKYHFIQ
jgi:hypothetical protein